MSYFQKFLTDKSFQILTELKKNYDFILIGGWAVYLYTNSLKSKDIDIIVDFSELEKLRKDFELEKNERLKKYQARIEEVEIDIYLPYFSKLGVPVESLLPYSSLKEGFKILEMEALLITKLSAYKQRKASIKGQKDLVDIVALITDKAFDFKKFNKLVKNFKLEPLRQELIELLKQTKELPELRLNKHQFSKLKKQLLPKLYNN